MGLAERVSGWAPLLRVFLATVAAALLLGPAGCADPGSQPPSPAPVAPAVALSLVATPAEAPAWTIAYGREFWRHAPHAAAGEVDLAGVIDRVSHVIARASDADLPAATTERYTATFDGRGLRLSPHLPSGADPSSALTVRTTQIAAGGRVLYGAAATDADAGDWSILGNTAQVQRAPAVGLIEHHEVRADGVELTWVLRDRAAARGAPFVVEVALDGLVRVGESAGGVHYADATGTSRVRVGAAELVDARGTRWPVPTELVDGGLRWRVPAEILDRATFPVALDPIIGAEFGMDTPLPGGSAGNQTSPAIASNGVDFFVVWDDTRNGARDIYGTRVSAAGVVLDAAGIAISTAANDQQLPAVAWNGTNYLVAWEDTRAGAASLTVYAARVSAAGAVLDAAGVSLAGGAYAYAPTVTSNGADWLVAWVAASDIRGTRVSAAGAVLDAGGIAISTAPNGKGNPAAAWSGTSYFVVWDDYRSASTLDIYGTRVSAAGTVLDPAGIAVSTATDSQRQPSIASNGAGFLVAWSDHRGPSGYEIYGTRISTAGAVLNAGGLAISLAVSDQGAPTVASNGVDYFVAWSDFRMYPAVGNDIYGSRVTGAGAVLDPSGIPLAVAADYQYNAALAWNGTSYLVAWQDPRWNPTIQNIFGARVTTTGTVTDPNGIPLSSAMDYELAPAVATNGTDYLVVWTDTRNSTAPDIHGARVSGAGVVLDATPVVISAAAGGQQNAAIAWSGANYLVVWQDYRSGTTWDIYGARVSSAGVVLDAAGVAVSTAANHQDEPSVASNGADWLVAWRDGRTDSYGDVYGARVSAAGGVLDAAGIVLATGAFGQEFPSVAATGSDYLVAWQDYNGGGRDILGKRVSGAGTVLDASAIAISTAASPQYTPSVASNGAGYFVAWQDQRLDFYGDIFGARVSAAGTVLDPAGVALSTAAYEQYEPAVASNGAGYLVVWQDRRSNTTYDIYGARVSAAGAAQDAAGLAVSLGASVDTVPVVAYNPSTAGYLVAYQARARTRARLLSYGCGDAIVDPGEGCDDGDLVGGDGCTGTCGVEPGYSCTGAAPSVCVDVDECAAGTDNCDANASCGNTVGSFSCACNVGYAGDGVVCADVDECAAGSDNCDVNASCGNTAGGFVCVCNGGYAGDGVTCADVDECAVGTDNCDVNAGCGNTAGGFVCVCNVGYVGDGVVCADVDECAAGSDNCDVNATCGNTAGSFGCACNVGYAGDGVVCADVDECAAGSDNCDADAACSNTVGSFSCACNAGYVGDGVVCADVDECAAGSDNCHADAACSNTVGSFGCACNVGYVGDGVTTCATVCGDGIPVGAEACDGGGGGVDTAACDADCTPSACGDAHPNAAAGEACDDGNADDTDSCLASCVAAVCGDGVVHAGVEQCDDGNTIDDDACRNDCGLASCGDGVLQAGEECDDGNAADGDACNSACARDTDADTIADVDEVDGDVDPLTPPTDTDADGTPDYQDDDTDGDGVLDVDEAGDADLDTPAVDTDADGTPDYRDVDSDDDGVADGGDDCRLVPDADQLDSDGDGVGDACQDDDDGDSVLDATDNCPTVANVDQADVDVDGVGDACDTPVVEDGGGGGCGCVVASPRRQLPTWPAILVPLALAWALVRTRGQPHVRRRRQRRRRS